MENDTNNEASLYSRLGGETTLRIFVDTLYDFMDSAPEVVLVRNMHTAGLSHASNRLYMFLSGMLGGPALYVEAFGHPRLRQKHLSIKIGNEERDQWLLCAQYAANQLDIVGHIREELMTALTVMANHLRNKNTNLGVHTSSRCNDIGTVQ